MHKNKGYHLTIRIVLKISLKIGLQQIVIPPTNNIPIAHFKKSHFDCKRINRVDYFMPYLVFICSQNYYIELKKAFTPSTNLITHINKFIAFVHMYFIWVKKISGYIYYFVTRVTFLVCFPFTI